MLELSCRIPSRYRADCATETHQEGAAGRGYEAAAGKDRQDEKLGFPVPLSDWLQEDKYYNQVKEAFQSDIAEKFFVTPELMKLLDDHKAGKSQEYAEDLVFLLLYRLVRPILCKGTEPKPKQIKTRSQRGRVFSFTLVSRLQLADSALPVNGDHRAVGGPRFPPLGQCVLNLVVTLPLRRRAQLHQTPHWSGSLPHHRKSCIAALWVDHMEKLPHLFPKPIGALILGTMGSRWITRWIPKSVWKSRSMLSMMSWLIMMSRLGRHLHSGPRQSTCPPVIVDGQVVDTKMPS